MKTRSNREGKYRVSSHVGSVRVSAQEARFSGWASASSGTEHPVRLTPSPLVLENVWLISTGIHISVFKLVRVTLQTLALEISLMEYGSHFKDNLKCKNSSQKQINWGWGRTSWNPVETSMFLQQRAWTHVSVNNVKLFLLKDFPDRLKDYDYEMFIRYH